MVGLKPVALMNNEPQRRYEVSFSRLGSVTVPRTDNRIIRCLTLGKIVDLKARVPHSCVRLGGSGASNLGAGPRMGAV